MGDMCLAWERKQVTGTTLGDGTLTRKNTFQRLFSPGELRTLVEVTTGVAPFRRNQGLSMRSDTTTTGLPTRLAEHHQIRCGRTAKIQSPLSQL